MAAPSSSETQIVIRARLSQMAGVSCQRVAWSDTRDIEIENADSSHVPFDTIDHLSCAVDPLKFIEMTNACGRGDIDFGQHAANDI